MSDEDGLVLPACNASLSCRPVTTVLISAHKRARAVARLMSVWLEVTERGEELKISSHELELSCHTCKHLPFSYRSCPQAFYPFISKLWDYEYWCLSCLQMRHFHEPVTYSKFKNNVHKTFVIAFFFSQRTFSNWTIYDSGKNCLNTIF